MSPFLIKYIEIISYFSQLLLYFCIFIKSSFTYIIVKIKLTGGIIMINEKLKELRKDFNISQVTLAKELGVSKQCVSNWENDNILPSIDMLIKISKYFNVSTDYLLGLEPKKTLDVSKLSNTQIAHLKLLIDDLIESNLIKL